MGESGMKLNVMERLALLNALPQQGSLVTLLTMKTLREKLMLKEEELEQWGVEMVDQAKGRVTWKENGVVEVEVSPRERDLIVDALEGMDKRGELTESYLEVCEKFGLAG